ncbi:MAG: MBL fold metallo-hydrolase [Haloarculaceae archaeon]
MPTRLRLLRHATLTVETGGQVLLVDPMLSDPGAIPPIPNSPNDRRNPLVELPPLDLDSVDAVLVTHLHRDHLDDAARERLPADVPLLCQPADADELEADGFTDVRPVADDLSWAGGEVARVPARHGTGDLAEEMGPVSGFVLSAPGEPTLYLAGDTVWYEAVEETLASFDPDATVVNTGEAQFVEGDPITTTRAGVAAVARHTDGAVVAVHMEAINHCLLTREELADYLRDEGVEGVTIPADGEAVRVTGRR